MSSKRRSSDAVQCSFLTPAFSLQLTCTDHTHSAVTLSNVFKPLPLFEPAGRAGTTKVLPLLFFGQEKNYYPVV